MFAERVNAKFAAASSATASTPSSPSATASAPSAARSSDAGPERLREYLVKGFTMDDERLKNPPVDGSWVPDYFWNRLNFFVASLVAEQ